MITLNLFVHKHSGNHGRRLRKVLQDRFQEIPCRVVTDTVALRENLNTAPRFGVLHVFVFLADTRERLDEFLQLNSSLDDRKIVLILPDNERATFAAGFRLYPRFVTVISESYEDVCEVLNTMMAYFQRTWNEFQSLRKQGISG